MRKTMLLCVTVVLLASMAVNALAERELWVAARDQIDIWNTVAGAGRARLDTITPYYPAGSTVAYLNGIAQNPANGEVLVGAYYFDNDTDWNLTTSHLMRYNPDTYAFLGQVQLDATPYGIQFGDNGLLYYADYYNIRELNTSTWTERLVASVGAAGTTDVAVKDGIAFTGLGYAGQSVRTYRVSDGVRLTDLYDEDDQSPTYQRGGFVGGTIGPDGTLLTASYGREAWEWDVLTAGVVDPTKFDAAKPTLRIDGFNPVWYWEKNLVIRYDDETGYVTGNYANSGLAYGDYATQTMVGGGPYAIAPATEVRSYHGFVDPNFTLATPKNRGDVTEDDFVGADDLVRILTHWGESGSVPWENGDCAPYGDGSAPGDDFVGADDYVEVLTYWGTDYSSPEPTPEPATLGLLLIGGLALIRRR